MDPLSLVLSRVLDEGGELAEIVEGRIANIFFIFSQAENHVKEMVAERTVLHRKEINIVSNAFAGLTFIRSSKRIEAYDSGASNHDAQVHQEFVDALNHTRLATEFERD